MPIIRSTSTIAPAASRGSIILAILAFAAASPAGAQRVRDSAGVAVIDHRDRTPPRAALTLSPLPVIAIGGVAGDPNYQFGQNVPAALRFADGRIVVADADRRLVRIYSPEGRYLVTLGRAGLGPGEYERPTNVFILPGDTVAVVDNNRADAILLFTTDGQYRRLERTRTAGFVSVLATGEWLTRSGGGPSGDSIRIYRRPRGDSVLAGPAPDSLARAADPAAAQAPQRGGRRGVPTPETGSLLAVLPGRLRSAPPDSQATPPAGAPVRTTPIGGPVPAFIQPPLVAGLPDGFLYGDPVANEIREYSASGALRRVIRRRNDLALTQSDIERYRSAQLAGREGDARREMEQRLSITTFPATRPAFQRILVDGARRIWAQHYEPSADAPLTWTVFDSTGRMLGDITTPPKFRVFDVGRDYVVGRWRDREGVAYIHVFALTATDRPGDARRHRRSP